MTMKTTATNTRLWERKSNGRNETLRKSNGNQPPTEGMREWASLYIYIHTLIIYFMDQFEIDFHIFTDIKFSFNLLVRFTYIYIHTLIIYFMDQFEIDFHIFTDIKFSFNL